MKTNYITLHPDRLDMPLEPCSCGRLSSAVFIVGGDIPDDIEALAVAVEYVDSSGATPETKRYTAAGTRQEDGTFRVYLAPAYFPASSDELKYHVVGTDEAENPRWLGTGNMRIFENPADGSPIAPDILPRNLYAYSPTRHCYFKVIAKENEYGEIQLDVDETEVHL